VVLLLVSQWSERLAAAVGLGGAERSGVCWTMRCECVGGVVLLGWGWGKQLAQRFPAAPPPRPAGRAWHCSAVRTISFITSEKWPLRSANKEMPRKRM